MDKETYVKRKKKIPVYMESYCVNCPYFEAKYANEFVYIEAFGCYVREVSGISCKYGDICKRVAEKMKPED